MSSHFSFGLYFYKLRSLFLFHSTKTKEPDNNRNPSLKSLIVTKLRTMQPKSRFLIANLLAVAVFVVLKTFIKIGPIYSNEDWTSIIFLYLTIIPILVISTNFRPSIAFTLSSLGIVIDELTFCFLHGYGGELWIQLIMALTSLVGVTVIISTLRKRNLFLAFLLGIFGYILGFYVPAYLYYCLMFNYYAVGLFFYSIAHVLIYIIFFPVILLFNKFYRTFSQNQDLETPGIWLSG